jgi:predicted  nucleic acid-binding Zn ribbon protein
MKKKNKKFSEDDIEGFLDGIDDDPDYESDRYMNCPRCGSEDWGWLTTNKQGKTVGCDQCRQIQNS